MLSLVMLQSGAGSSGGAEVGHDDGFIGATEWCWV